MFQLEPINPPLGGPELECSFAYRELRVEHLLKLVPAIFDNGFKLDVNRVFGSVDPEEVDPSVFKDVEDIETVIQQAEASNCHQLMICFVGMLGGLKMGLGITLRLDCGVVMVSVPEDMLWAFSGDPAKAELSRLKAFTKVCQQVARAHPPEFAYFDTEGVNPEELTVTKSETVRGLEPYHESLFDDEDTLLSLLAWYTEHNLEQWQHWT